MASSKEPSASRPVSGTFSSRQPSSSGRQHSHSISLSATNPSHRVNRRKSVNAGAASTTAQAAIAAALKEGELSGMPIHNHRRSLGSRKNTESHSLSARPNMHSFFNGTSGASPSHDNDAVEDLSNDEENQSSAKNFTNRNRRASEGSYLIKGDGKKSADLRCDMCGKGYKHNSCLTKHKWEHDPAWAITSKFLISKHQQVQLLEAAQVLRFMSGDSATAQPDFDAAAIDASEDSSASPGFSSSEMQDEISSVETTPPPMSEAAFPVPESKRHSSSSNGFSRSYRSVQSSSYAESFHSPGLPPYRLSGVDFRPSTSGTDDGTLAAAAAGLSFSSGTPRTKAAYLSADVPPVPPLPQQYQQQSFNSKSADSTLTAVYNPLLQLHPPTLTQQLSDERNYREHHDDQDVHMDEDESIFRMDQ